MLGGMLTFHVSMGVSVAQHVLESECNVETSDSAKCQKSPPRVNTPSDRCCIHTYVFINNTYSSTAISYSIPSGNLT